MTSVRAANRSRFAGQGRWFEIWFAVVFDTDARRALWVRYDVMKPASGSGEAIVWAALSDADADPAVVAFKQVLPWRSLGPIGEEMAWGATGAIGDAAWRGCVSSPAGELTWRLEWLGDDQRLPPRQPRWLDAVPLPTHVSDGRDRERVRAEIEVGGRRLVIDGVGVQKHIWGTRRVERLFWLYCPAWQAADGGLEALSTSGRTAHPAVGAVAGVLDGRELTGRAGLQLLTNGVRVVPGERLEFRAVGMRQKLVARARCDPATLIGYLYRDPSGVDIPVAQSDLGDCELDVYQRRAPRGEWQLARRIHAPQAALEFHGARLPGVRYLEWLQES